jgi:hypothetical protein
MRMSLEKVNGKYQGACYPFREGFQSGTVRARWGNDGSIFVGMTSRGGVLLEKIYMAYSAWFGMVVCLSK